MEENSSTSDPHPPDGVPLNDEELTVISTEISHHDVEFKTEMSKFTYDNQIRNNRVSRTTKGENTVFRLTLIALVSIIAVALIALSLFIFRGNQQTTDQKRPDVNMNLDWRTVLDTNKSRFPLTGERLRLRDSSLAVVFHRSLQGLTDPGGTESGHGTYNVWSDEVESYLAGLDEDSVGADWSALTPADIVTGKLRQSIIERMDVEADNAVEGWGRWRQCGAHEKDRLLFFQGSKMISCARYREPQQQLLLGQILSFYLSRFLGIKTVLPSVLSEVHSSVDRWHLVSENLTASDWRQGSLVSVTPWHNASKTNPSSREFWNFVPWAPIPPLVVQILAGEEDGADSSGGANFFEGDLVEMGQLAQWSDLALFDYLSGNPKRVSARLEFVARENGGWSMLNSTIPNLLSVPRQKVQITTENPMRDPDYDYDYYEKREEEKRKKRERDSRIWFVNNESGMIDGYSLLYPEERIDLMEDAELAGDQSTVLDRAERFRWYSSALLRTFCVFRGSTVERLDHMVASANQQPHIILEQFIDKVSEGEPLYAELAERVGAHVMAPFNNQFGSRVIEAWRWIQSCGK